MRRDTIKWHWTAACELFIAILTNVSYFGKSFKKWEQSPIRAGLFQNKTRQNQQTSPAYSVSLVSSELVFIKKTLYTCCPYIFALHRVLDTNAFRRHGNWIISKTLNDSLNPLYIIIVIIYTTFTAHTICKLSVVFPTCPKMAGLGLEAGRRRNSRTEPEVSAA